MNEMYKQSGIQEEVYAFGKEVEGSLKERFEKIDAVAEYNS